MSTQPGARPEASKAPEAPDMKEYGAPKDGVRQSADRRLFVQLFVLTGGAGPANAAEGLERICRSHAQRKAEAVLYAGLNDPRSVGVLFLAEDPAAIQADASFMLAQEPFLSMSICPEMTMIGRSYSLGYEADLEDWLLRKPRRNVMDPAHAWAVWYPLRRKPEFEGLSKDEQRSILMEHGTIGMAYGQAGLAQDVRLACHGLDSHDNEFLLGLVGKELAPLSKLVQEMRKTRQTALYIQQMGPFFVGRVLARFPLAG